MLQKYSFKVVPKPGSANTCANALSHWDKLLGEEGVQTLVVMLPNAYCKVVDTDFAIKVQSPANQEELLSWFDQVLEGWKAGQHLYIPMVLRLELMAQMYDHPAEGHFGIDKMHKRILEFYMWPRG